MKEIKTKLIDVRICRCGRIHAIPNEKIDNALKEEKNLLFVCKRCGQSILIGGDYHEDFEYNFAGYYMYSHEMREDTDIINEESFVNTDSHKGISEIILNKGYPVPMNNGSYANSYFNGNFYDYSRPDFWSWNLNKNSTVKELFELIDDFRRISSTVNMQMLIHTVPEDVLEELSKYMISGLNWKGTKWETEWNSK